ncbi:MAG TPA: hypothetical protein VF715_04110 [Thermoleophilaceae bacterium]
MSGGAYMAGLLFFAGTWGSAAVVAVVLRRSWLGHLRGGAAVLAAATLFLAALVAVHLIPGVLGLLHRGWVLALAMLMAGTALYLLRLRGPGEADRASDTEERDWRLLVLPGALAIGVAAWALVLAWNGRSTLVAPVTSVDLLTFDLPLIGRWIQTHSIWVAGDLFPLQAHAAYPHNGELVRLAAVLPWRSAFLLPVLAWPIWGLGAFAVHVLARELGAKAWSATLLAAAYAATPLILITTAADNVSDPLMWAMLTVGALFLVRHVRRPRRAELVVAGIALGLAFGSKWYALTCVPILVAVWLMAKWRVREGGQTILGVARDGAVLVATIAAAGGFWLVRNLVEYGNPLFPHELSLGPLHLFSGPEDTVGDAYGFSVAHYIGDWSVWREHLLPQYNDVLRAPGVVLLAGITLTAVLGAWRARGRATYMALTAVLLVLAYLVTPQTAFGPEGAPVFGGVNARYATPALLLGAAAIAAGLARVDRRLWIPAQLLVVVAVVDGARSPLDVYLPKFLGAAALVAAAAFVLWRVRPSRRTLAVGAVTVLVLAAVAGFAQQKRFDDEGFTGDDPAIDWILSNTGEPHRIGMTGSWPVDAPPSSALFGPRFENHVRYVGREDRGLMRHHATYADWRRAVRNADLDLLLVGRVPQPFSPSPEAAWAARAGFPAVATSPRFAVYRLGRADQD